MDISLLIHTCDDYLRFWPGMLFSLDFNWDFNSVPVYWASEEISIHNSEFTCRDIPYTQNKKGETATATLDESYTRKKASN